MSQSLPKDKTMDESRRRNLVAASTPVFARRGFEAPAMDELAEACACTRRTLYRYFPTKEDLFWAVAVQAYTALAVRLRVTAAVWDSAGMGAADRIKSWADAYLDHSLEDPEGFKVIMAGRERAVSTIKPESSLPACAAIAELATLDQEVLGGLASLSDRLETEGLAPAGQGSVRLWELLAVLIALVEFHARYRGGGKNLPFGNSEGIRRMIAFQVQAHTTLSGEKA